MIDGRLEAIESALFYMKEMKEYRQGNGS